MPRRVSTPPQPPPVQHVPRVLSIGQAERPELLHKQKAVDHRSRHAKNHHCKLQHVIPRHCSDRIQELPPDIPLARGPLHIELQLTDIRRAASEALPRALLVRATG